MKNHRLIAFSFLVSTLFYSLDVCAYFDVRTFISFTETSSSIQRTFSFVETGIGTTIAVGNLFFIGGDLEYSSLLEIKDQNKKIGFYKSYKYYQLLPTVGINFHNFIFKFSLITFGQIRLETGNDLTQISYRDPEGQRIAVLHKLQEGSGWAIGSYYQLTKFNDLRTSAESRQNATGHIARMWVLGVVMAYIF